MALGPHSFCSSAKNLGHHSYGLLLQLICPNALIQTILTQAILIPLMPFNPCHPLPLVGLTGGMKKISTRNSIKIPSKFKILGKFEQDARKF